MFLLRMLMRRGRGRAMDPLQVSMTGVRMGERFLQIGCHDRALLAGLAAKVGLSGASAVAAFDRHQIKLAEKVGAEVGALIEAKPIDDDALPFETDYGFLWRLRDGLVVSVEELGPTEALEARRAVE